MKKILHWIAISTALFTSFLTLGSSLAYAEEAPQAAAPTITLNGEPAPIRTEMIDGKLYFSLRDYWVHIALKDPATIKWFGDTQTVSDGYHFIRLNDQTLYTPSLGSLPLKDPAILKNGTTYVAVSFLNTSNHSNYADFEVTDTSIHFRNLIWEQEGYDLKNHFRISPIPVDEKTGYPDFEALKPAYDYGFRNENFDITKMETEDGKTIFTYVSKEDPEKTMRVTAQDGYVSHVIDNGAIILYRPRC